jgi:DNA-binding NarL/FixJ family response regulator
MTAARPIRVLLVDCSAHTHNGLRTLLDDLGFEVCAEAADAHAALDAVRRQRPDVCLLDIDLPGDSIAAVEMISSEAPETAVVVMTASEEEADLVRALRAGASGYLLKSRDPASLLPLTIRAAVSGEVALPRSLVSRLIDGVDKPAQLRRHLQELGVALTQREEEVLELLCDGLTTAEIAGRLFVSQVTVRTHVASIVRKLHVSDRAGVLRLLAGRGAELD